MTKDDILRMIDEATAPKVMSKEEALDWLEDLESLIEFRCDALREEIGE